jgi:flagellar biosynthesis component FlhA/small nuclear ribonucleoprotein (snRNP)-like protein
MDYHSQLKRFLNRRVCVELWGRSTVWGTLSSVDDDHLRLLDTIIVGESEGQGWFERMQYGEADSHGGPRNAETIIRIEVVMHVTCADDDLPDPPPDTQAFGEPIEGAAADGESQHEIGNEFEDFFEQERALSLRSEPITVELGFGLIRLAVAGQGGDLLDRIHRIRVEIAQDTGVIIPRVRVKDCRQLKHSEFCVRVFGHTVATGELFVDRLLATNLNASVNLIDGVDVTGPLAGLPAKWIEPDQQGHVRSLGGCVLEPSEVLATRISSCVRERLNDLLGYQDVIRLIDGLKRDHADAIAELVPHQVSVLQLHRLLKSLLEERVSIRNLIRILESVAYHSSQASDYGQWLQRVRVDIGTDICAPLLDDDGSLKVLRIDANIEESLAGQDERNANLVEERYLSDFAFSLPTVDDVTVILVRRGEVRRTLFEAISAHRPHITVIAENEVPLGVDLVCEDARLTGPKRLSPK